VNAACSLHCNRLQHLLVEQKPTCPLLSSAQVAAGEAVHELAGWGDLKARLDERNRRQAGPPWGRGMGGGLIVGGPPLGGS
jgi:hypothetical protein